jgi:hypothetical protein
MIVITLAAFVAISIGFAYFLHWWVDWPLWIDALVIVAAALVVFGLYMYHTRVKVIRDFPKTGDMRWHLAGWKFKHYDRFLDPRVRYARHAQAIDEMRADFARVGWGRTKDQANAPDDWLLQRWFAGNHSDIGGSYSETESRLSDIALEWMARELEKAGALIDWTKLNIFPDAAGMQHCEIAAVRDLYPTWIPRCLRLSWREEIRPDVAYVNCDETVLKRLELETISKCGMQQRYRPEALRSIPEFLIYYSSHEIPAPWPTPISCLRASATAQRNWFCKLYQST